MVITAAAFYFLVGFYFFPFSHHTVNCPCADQGVTSAGQTDEAAVDGSICLNIEAEASAEVRDEEHDTSDDWVVVGLITLEDVIEEMMQVRGMLRATLSVVQMRRVGR